MQESLKLEGDGIKTTGMSQHILADNALEEDGEEDGSRPAASQNIF